MKMNNNFIGLEHLWEDHEWHDWLWYEHESKTWKPVEKCTGWRSSSNSGIHSFKAARRHLRKHDEIPKGTRFRLVSRFVGYDRILVKK